MLSIRNIDQQMSSAQEHLRELEELRQTLKQEQMRSSVGQMNPHFHWLDGAYGKDEAFQGEFMSEHSWGECLYGEIAQNRFW